MTNAFVSVIIASAQSVAKVYLIGSAGYLAVHYPKSLPLLPRSTVGIVARLSFNVFTLSLVYSTIAISVTYDSLGEYWFVLVGGVAVIGISYTVATVIGKWIVPITNARDFNALRISATFPNIVALPILIFPSLCEYSVVAEGYFGDHGDGSSSDGVMDGSASEDVDYEEICASTANTMVFLYFFVWSFLFWSMGQPQLIAAATPKDDASSQRWPDDSLNLSEDQDSSQHQDTPHDSTFNQGSHGSHHEASLTDGTPSSDLEQSGEQQVDQLDATSMAGSRNAASPLSADSERESADSNLGNGKVHAELEVKDQQGTNDASDSRGETGRMIKEENSMSGTNEFVSKPTAPSQHDAARIVIVHHGSTRLPPTTPSPATPAESTARCEVCRNMYRALIQTVSSPGFLAMMAGFITACIPPLQKALFDSGGPLRFLGSAVESMGSVSPVLSTLVVAASISPPPAVSPDALREDDRSNNDDDGAELHTNNENPAMTDPNFGPQGQLIQRRRRRSSLVRLRQSITANSHHLLQSAKKVMQSRPSPEWRKLHLWFNISRLVITPLIVVGITIALDCGTSLLSGVPHLVKLVLILNSCLPGALIVVVILKSNDKLADTAAVVAKVYLPSYLLSIISIAAWTAVGLWISLPDDDGLTFCQRT